MRFSLTHARVLGALWAVALVAGLVGVGIRLATGEEQAAFGSYIPWGLWVALYAYLGGLSAGAFLLFAVGELFGIERLRAIGRPALVVSFASLVGGLVVVGLDLGHLGRAWEVIGLASPRSLMAWEISFFTAYGLLLLATMRVAFRGGLARRFPEVERPRPLVPLIPDQDLDPLLGVVEELEAALGQLDPLLERLERFIEGEVAAFERLDDFFEAAQRLFKFQRRHGETLDQETASYTSGSRSVKTRGVASRFPQARGVVGANQAWKTRRLRAWRTTPPRGAGGVAERE